MPQPKPEHEHEPDSQPEPEPEPEHEPEPEPEPAPEPAPAPEHTAATDDPEPLAVASEVSTGVSIVLRRDQDGVWQEVSPRGPPPPPGIGGLPVVAREPEPPLQRIGLLLADPRGGCDLLRRPSTAAPVQQRQPLYVSPGLGEREVYGALQTEADVTRELVRPCPVCRACRSEPFMCPGDVRLRSPFTPSGLG
eukprot:COSAG01_NODE_4979_length_4565_cov_5.005364_2_plen_193_part_00